VKHVNTKPRYRCDFCKHVSTESAMKRHERICWKNPNRYCDNCNNTGKQDVDTDAGTFQDDCFYCSKRSPEALSSVGGSNE